MLECQSVLAMNKEAKQKKKTIKNGFLKNSLVTFIAKNIVH